MVDSIIRLFESTATKFLTNGIGVLSDATECIVTEERNGEFELEMQYPIVGTKYSEIVLRRIIVAKSNPTSDYQGFRIYAISKPINGEVTINAEHVSYDLNGYIASPFSAPTASDAMSSLSSKSATTCPFSFSTDIESESGSLQVVKPTGIRSILGGEDNSILDIWGGEYEFDNFNVILHESRGNNNGVTIRYGKNLTDVKQEENCSEVYTGVYPYWYSENDGLVQLDEKIINCEGTFDYTRIYLLDLTSEYSEKPSQASLRETANEYISNNDIGTPKVSLDVSFVSLQDAVEYSNYKAFETINLCDTVTVIFDELGVNSTAKCIKTEYNVLTDKYDSIELGEATSDLATTIAGQSTTLDDTATKTYVNQTVELAVSGIAGSEGGYILLRNSTGASKYPDELLIMDSASVLTAERIFRWNSLGLYYSSDGYDGTFNKVLDISGNRYCDNIESFSLNENALEDFDTAVKNSETISSLNDSIEALDKRIAALEELSNASE